jgi:hypothetical protein
LLHNLFIYWMLWICQHYYSPHSIDALYWRNYCTFCFVFL